VIASTGVVSGRVAIVSPPTIGRVRGPSVSSFLVDGGKRSASALAANVCVVADGAVFGSTPRIEGGGGS
jgi:hypothetical protein